MIKYIKEIIDYFYSNPFLHGPTDRLSIGERVSKANTIFNTRSGSISIGEGVIFGHNCMVLTGLHNINTSEQNADIIFNFPIITDTGKANTHQIQ